MHDRCQLLLSDFVSSFIEIIVDDPLLNKLLENVRTQLQTRSIGQSRVLRIGLQLIAVSIFKLSDANVDAVDFRSIV